MSVTIPVMEVFGPTIQGEGMAIGRKTMFVRTGGCDYQCVWCDSKFTWDGSQKAEMLTPAEIWDRLVALGAGGFDYVTISGGNPALIGHSMAQLIHLLHTHGVQVGLETQGSRWQEWFLQINQLTLSPKPPSSGMAVDESILQSILERVRDGQVDTSLKVVVFDDDDYAFARKIHDAFPDVPLFLSVGNDNVSDTADVSRRLLEKTEWLVSRVLADDALKDVRVLPQLHVLLWGNKRGV